MSTDDEDIVKAVLPGGSIILYDLKNKKEVTTIKVNVENWGAEDTLKLTGGKQPEPSFDEMISEEDVVEGEDQSPNITEAAKKPGPKKVGPKKTSNTKKKK